MLKLPLVAFHYKVVENKQLSI